MDGNLHDYVQSRCVNAAQVAQNRLLGETVTADQVRLLAALPAICGAGPVMASQQAPTLDASGGMRGHLTPEIAAVLLRYHVFACLLAVPMCVLCTWRKSAGTEPC